MAGSHHTGRRSWRPSTVRGRTLATVLDGRRQAEADLRRALYVRPLGYGFHVVKNVCNDQEYTVADGLGFKRTFTPGTAVLLGSQTGHPGELLMAGPPSGVGGSSAYGVQRVYRTTGPAPVVVPTYTEGPGAVWYDSGTVYAAWLASTDTTAYLRIGTMEPEYIAEEPATNALGTESALVPDVATILYTIAETEFSPALMADPGLFAVFDGVAVVQVDSAALATVDLSDGSVLAVNDSVSFSAPSSHRQWGAVVVADTKLVLYVSGDFYSYDWPSLTNEATAAAPSKANTEILGIAPHADGIAFFLAGNGVLGREKIYRWTYDTTPAQVQGETLYSLTGSKTAMIKARTVVYSGGGYQIPATSTGPLYGMVEINSAHNGQSSIINSLWTDENVPARIFEASVPGGGPVSGTAVDPAFDSVTHVISNGAVAYVEIVEQELPDI